MPHYLAYGSNMDAEDLSGWCADRGLLGLRLRDLSPARLDGFELRFNYFSTVRNCGAANILPSPGKCVHGLLARISESDLGCIRRKEGFFDKDSHRNFYDEITVEVEKKDGSKVVNVITYRAAKAREKGEHQPPSKYYMQLLIGNAKRYGFPSEYIQFLESIETID